MSNTIISVPFHNDTLTATLVDGVPYVALKPICEKLGIDWASQFTKIKQHPILSKGIVMVTTPSKGGLQEMLMLPLKMLNGWLFGIDSRRVKESAKEAILLYQEECFDVLANHFMPKLKYGLKQMPLPCFETPIIISRHTTMMTNEMITQFKHAIDVFARESNLTKNRISRRLADAFDADNWKLIPIENYPHVCAKLGVNPIFEVESTNDIAIVESKKVAQLERDNQLLRMELYRIKEGSVGESPVNSQAMKENILKIADALDELAFYA